MSQGPWQNPNNEQRGGAPAEPPAYPAHPGGAYGAPVPPARPPMPNTVRLAVTMMYAGMVIGLIRIGIGLSELGRVRGYLRDHDHPQTTIDSNVRIFTAGIIVGGLIGAGLWLWMALATRAGQNYARIVSSVFFGIGVLSNLNGLGSGWVPAVDKLFSALILLAGFLAVVFVWNQRSGPYFRRPPAGPEYGYGLQQPPSGQREQPPYGQPPYGQG
ncbi:MAG: hypothetical protein ACJ786_27450 [Catenulispora sp.]